MDITKEKNGQFTVVNIEGRVDTTNSAILESEMEALFNSGEKFLIFNCNGLNYISSSGLRVFLVAQKKTIALQGKLYLCNLQPSIKEIFVISGFSTIFRIFDSLEEALEE
jgi:anti-sigma B factor antagonist